MYVGMDQVIPFYFLVLEKVTSDRVVRDEISSVLYRFGLGSQLTRALCEDSRALYYDKRVMH